MTARTVHLHVGIAKTGTTYLQRRLFANRERLERHGVRYPGSGPVAHFLGSLDLRAATFQGHSYDGAEGAWRRLVRAADDFGGATVISHETLARAKPEHIERAVNSFAVDDVRVVVTVRDFARQAPAVWQETLKNRSVTPYSEFLDGVFNDWRTGGRAIGRFWRAQDIEAVVRRWADGVGAARVTVVTVPPRGADPDELWRRFSLAVGLPDIAFVDPEVENSSLGVAEAELLRRLNPLLVDALDWPAYEGRIKRRFAERVLAPQSVAGRLTLPSDRMAEAAGIAASQMDFLVGSGVALVGSLDDLQVPTNEEQKEAQVRQPGELTERDLLAAALPALAALAATPPRAPHAASGTLDASMGSPLRSAAASWLHRARRGLAGVRGRIPRLRGRF